jgi:hypothetical protein
MSRSKAKNFIFVEVEEPDFDLETVTRWKTVVSRRTGNEFQVGIDQNEQTLKLREHIKAYGLQRDGYSYFVMPDLITVARRRYNYKP